MLLPHHFTLTEKHRGAYAAPLLIGGTLINRGTGPILMEPVICDIILKRPGTPTVHVLDHDGRRTGKTLPVENGRVKLDGRETKAVYYEVSYE